MADFTFERDSMSLIEDFVSRTPAGYDDYPNHDEIADEVGATQVHYDVVDTWRWGNIVEYVYNRDDEYVSLVYREASGDGECEYEPDITEVVPVTKTITVYEVKN